jgi:adenine/guanine phosphoribosyltransferase-like PRPP-binding protein
MPVHQLLRRTEAPAAFRKPARDAFALIDQPVSRAEAKTVALVDDVYATGARLNSAAFVLREAGIRVAISIVMARRVNPQMGDPRATAFWDRQVATPFDWTGVT